MSLQRTPLFDAHTATGGKLVDFGGWELPVNYGSQIAEHEAVRTDAGMFDVSHMLVTDVAGDNAKPFYKNCSPTMLLNCPLSARLYILECSMTKAASSMT